MTTITFGQQNPLVYRSTYPDPTVLDGKDLVQLRKEADRHGIAWEYQVWDGVDDAGNRINERTEQHTEARLKDILRDHHTTSISPDVSATVTTFRTSPDSSLSDTIKEIETVVARHGDPPDWIDSEDQALARVLADMFGCELGTPAGVEDDYYTVNGPPGVGSEPVTTPKKGKGAGGVTTTLTTLAMFHILLFRFMLHLRTNAGRDHQAGVSFDTASTGTGIYSPAEFIAVTEDATAPAAGDTTLTAELTTEGFTRAQAAYAHSAGTATVTMTKTFTMSGGTSRTIRHAGLFTLIAVGILVYKTAVPSPPTLVSGDSVAFTWTFTL